MKKKWLEGIKDQCPESERETFEKPVFFAFFVILSVRQIILLCHDFSLPSETTSPPNTSPVARLEPETVETAQASVKTRTGTLTAHWFLFKCDVHVAGKGLLLWQRTFLGWFIMFWIVWLYLNIGSFFSEDLLPFECLHCWNSLAVSWVKETTWWPNNSGSWDPIHAFSNLIVIWYLHPFCIHFFCVSLKQLQSWTLNLLIADSWHPVPWPSKTISRRSACKSLQAKGPVKVEGVVKAQRSLPSPWHCSCRPWSFATAVCCWAVGVPVRSPGALPGF